MTSGEWKCPECQAGYASEDGQYPEEYLCTKCNVPLVMAGEKFTKRISQLWPPSLYQRCQDAARAEGLDFSQWMRWVCHHATEHLEGRWKTHRKVQKSTPGSSKQA